LVSGGDIARTIQTVHCGFNGKCAGHALTEPLRTPGAKPEIFCRRRPSRSLKRESPTEYHLGTDRMA
jgi:hypothetical protein